MVTSIRRINVCGAIDQEKSIDPTLVEALLGRSQAARAGRAGEFTGRPSTVLIADDELVLKKRSELRYRARDQMRWVAQAIEQERRLSVHHPAKTWLIVHEGDEQVIANVTPRLAALNHWMPETPAEHGVTVLEALLEMYTDIFVRHERQLDPGLSNFGTDAEGRLFYLDDESAPARGLASLAAAIASWFRVLPWADEAVGTRIGGQLRRLLLDSLEDPHPALVVRDQLIAAFAADERQSRALDALERELVPATRPARPAGQSRGDRRSGPARYLVLMADIHGNRIALERALAWIDDLPDAELWVLGDVVGYGPEPAACVSRLMERPDALVIKGNHDHAVALGRAGRGFSPLARQVVDWTVDALSDAQRRWLMELPPVHANDGWLAVHGAPQDPTYFNGYVYRMTYADNLDALARRGLPYCVHGHTHVAGAYWRRGHQHAAADATAIDLTGADHWLICPGSVGQPRSGQPGCELAVIDRHRLRVEWERLDYDIDAVVRAIHRAGLPPQLGDRLLSGR